jgi:catechol 2,3-dioxygenase-like lactoylglutathione lyase family enzyme
MTLAPTGLDHVALNVPDVPAAIEFYTKVLGLR